jgi:hypothetical protein
VALMLPLFFLSMDVLRWVMGFFGGDPGQAVVENGKETFPPGAGGRGHLFHGVQHFQYRGPVSVRRYV